MIILSQGATQAEKQKSTGANKQREVVIIPVKNGAGTNIVLQPQDQKIIENLAMKILKETGRYSKSEAARRLIRAGAEVLGIVSIFTYGMKKGVERLAEANVKNVSLTDFDEIAKVAADEGYIKTEDIDRLIKFRNNPQDESWIGG